MAILEKTESGYDYYDCNYGKLEFRLDRGNKSAVMRFDGWAVTKNSLEELGNLLLQISRDLDGEK